MKRNLLFLSFLFSFNLMFAQTNPHNFSVGTNLTDINSYGPQIIFKDLMKHAQEWVMLNPTTFNFIRNSDGSLTNIPRTLLRSADGYPLSSPLPSVVSRLLHKPIFWMEVLIRCRPVNMKFLLQAAAKLASVAMEHHWVREKPV